MNSSDLKSAHKVPCAHCNGSGQIIVPADVETIEVYYFGCRGAAGHYWFLPNNDLRYISNWEIDKNLPSEFQNGRIDSGFCPGGGSRNKNRAEIPGEAKLTVVSGWTVLGWWDRSVDKRGGSNSNILAKGTFDFTTMLEIGKVRFPEVMKRQLLPITLVK